jgi:hypothetical protein
VPQVFALFFHRACCDRFASSSLPWFLLVAKDGLSECIVVEKRTISSASDMGSLPGKITGRQDVWDIKAFRLEEKVERLESEVRKMRSEIENYHKEQKGSATPCPSTTNGRGRYSLICEPHSGKYTSKHRIYMIFIYDKRFCSCTITIVTDSPSTV